MNKNSFKNFFLEFLIFILFFCLYFNYNSFEKTISNAGYLLNWFPWATTVVDSSKIDFNPVLSDSVDYVIPILQEIRIGLLHGQLPLWTDKISFGTPLLLPVFFNIFVFPFLPILLAFSLNVGLTLFVFWRIVIAYIGMRFFLSKLKISPLVTMVMAFLFSYSLYGITILGDTNFSAYSYIPWLFLGIELLLEKITIKRFLLLIFIIFNIIVAGFPSTSFYILFLSAIYVVFCFIFLLKRKINRIKNFVLIILSYLFSIGLSLFTLLPTYNFFKQINLGYRESIASSSYFALKKLSYLFNAKFFGSVMDKNFFADSNWNEQNIYQGLLPLFMVCFSFFLLRKKNFKKDRIVFFQITIVIIFIILFNIGNSLAIVSKLPIFNFNPSTRLIVLLPFLFTTIGALVIQYLFENLKNNRKLKFQLIFTFLILIGFYILVLIKNQFSGIPLDLQQFRENQITISISLLIFNILFLLFLNKKNRKFILSCILILSLFDIYNSSKGYMPTLNKNEQFYPITPAISFLQKNSMLGDKILPIGRNLIPSMPLYYGLDNIVGHYWASPELKNLVVNLSKNTYDNHPTQVFFEPENIKLNSSLIDILGVRYITLNPNELPIWYKSIVYQREFNTSCSINKDNDFIIQNIKLNKNDQLKFIGVQYSPNIDNILNLTIEDENGKELSKTSLIKNDVFGEWNVFQTSQFLSFKTDKLIKLKFKLNRKIADSVTMVAVNFNRIPNGGIINNINDECSDLKIFVSTDKDKELQKKFHLVYDQGDLRIFENLGKLPNVFFISKLLPINIGNTSFDFNNVDYKNEAFVYQEDLSKNNNLLLVSSKIYDQNGKINDIIWGEEYIKLKVETNTPKILFLRKKYYPGWQVKVDGVKVDLFRINGIFTGVEIGAGSHLVEMEYKEQFLNVGLTISLITCFLILLTVFYLKRKTKNYKKSISF